MQSILLTAAKEDAESFLSCLGKEKEVFHMPLEVYKARTDDSHITEVLSQLGTFQNIVYASKRNARFFLLQLKRFDKVDAVTDGLNLAFDESIFNFLEAHDVAAVHPQKGSKPIDLLELMFRLRRLGKTLYPCGAHRREDFPGLLEEMDIPVTELDVFDLQGPTGEQLGDYQKKIADRQPDVIIFHSRRSVNRTLAAFPDLNYKEPKIISADKAISEKLEKRGISVDEEGGGSWKSVAASM